MRKLFPVILLFFFFGGYSQTHKVKGGLSTIDTADLTILNIYPDSFPNVSVVFKAETRKGEPVWNLTKEQMRVKENGQSCSVILLEKVTKNSPINLGIVIDHSGSMASESMDFQWAYSTSLDILSDSNETSPLENAKAAVRSFATSFNFSKDFISVIGFSNTVDKPLALTQNVGDIDSIINGMQPDGSTSLYDGMLAGINEIVNANGIRVLVVLTDGNDNTSITRPNDVIYKAKKEDIPIYIIGLGYVNKDTLELIAKSTKGHFYYTKSSSSLNAIYALISRQVQAYYNLIYTSPNLSVADSTRQIELSFDVDSLYLVSNTDTLSIPTEVIAYMQQKEKRKEYQLYGGVAVAVMGGFGVLLFFFAKRRNDKPIIHNLFPNPSKGIINLAYESPSGQLHITSLNNTDVKIIDIEGTEALIDLSQLNDGDYVAFINAKGQRSNAVRFTVKR